ncbi:UNKNOWN [Stylonychia lemnae]|uniref:Transmembrane protein n=1 Tax=Stylonychia lemnae TaxID=5949 RepID=A0A078ASW4_STYLE|nr:UNKNOWN [Stylonychia lemnae]|eukprot:CDW85279.1 UNKNOWN [Stylonychia lemnae]
MRIICFLIWFPCFLSIIVLNLSPVQFMCHEQMPYFLCVASKKCAFIQRSNPDSYWLDLVPYMTESRCVYRGDLRHFLYQGIEKSIELVNTAASQLFSLDDNKDIVEIDQDEESLKSIKDNQILKDLKYFYENVAYLQRTRYELGLWLIGISFFFLYKYLKNCRNWNGYQVQLDMEKIRLQRELMLKEKKINGKDEINSEQK